MNYNEPSVLIVGGGKWQVPLVRLAKRHGLRVICTDRNTAPPAAFEYADIGLTCDARDIAGTINIAREYRIDAVISDQSDIAVPTVASVAESLKLNGIGSEVARRFTDKYSMRLQLERSMLPLPAFRRVNSVSELKRYITELPGTLILKPPDSQSSRGVCRLDRSRSLTEQFERCMDASSCGWILVEQFIEGPEYTVEGCVFDDTAYTLAISEKTHILGNDCVAQSLTYPSALPPHLVSKLSALNETILRMFELPFGITHAEFRRSGEDFYLVEIAARGGGTLISSDIVPYLCGFRPDEILLNVLLERPYSFQLRQKGAARLEFFNFPAGIVERLEIPEFVYGLPSLHTLEFAISAGDAISKVSDDSKRHGYMILLGETRESVIETARTIREHVKVHYVDGRALSGLEPVVKYVF